MNKSVGCREIITFGTNTRENRAVRTADRGVTGEYQSDDRSDKQKEGYPGQKKKKNKKTKETFLVFSTTQSYVIYGYYCLRLNTGLSLNRDRLMRVRKPVKTSYKSQPSADKVD